MQKFFEFTEVISKIMVRWRDERGLVKRAAGRADPVLAEPVQIKDGHAQVDDTPGSGVLWNEAAIERYKVSVQR